MGIFLDFLIVGDCHPDEGDRRTEGTDILTLQSYFLREFISSFPLRRTDSSG
jgi:hypothetical protein